MFISEKEDIYFITDSDGTIRWYKSYKLHRDTGPAVIYSGGTKVWYQEGKLHREDGPAVVYSNGVKYWYYHGKNLEVKTQKEFEKLIELKLFW